MYVHIPSYESKGNATPHVINRCLWGMVVMQLTMMGVLALKSTDTDEKLIYSTREQWSEYAQMVVGVAPLLFCTYFVYNLLNQAYEKQIRNVPLEVVGSAQRSFMSYPLPAFPPPSHGSQELSEVDPDTRLKNRLSLFSTQSVTPNTDPIPEEADSQAKVKLTTKYSMVSILDPTVGEESPFHDPNEEDPEMEVSFQHSSYEALENPDSSMLRHVEPPMTRVEGILDIPIGSAMLKHGEQDHVNEEEEDRLLYSYLHPALIGRLPVVWSPDLHFEHLRKEQIEEQKKLLKRFTYRQRLSVENPSEEEGSTTTNPVRAFIDGFTSWIHLALS
jgi:hypothetical protein